MTLFRNSTDINLFVMTLNNFLELSLHLYSKETTKTNHEYEGLTNLNYFSRKLTKIDLQN